MQKHKKLPHIDADGYYQFVTFRTNDSIDAYIASLLTNTNLKSSHKQYKIDKYLDNSKNGAYLNGAVLAYLYDFLKTNDKTTYELISFVIMPNHLHILFKQIKPISQTIKSLKARSAKEINLLLEKSGKFWASDYYDKVIRDDEHFAKVYKYIQNNALKANLNINERFYSIYT
jgi:putative transposase